MGDMEGYYLVASKIYIFAIIIVNGYVLYRFIIPFINNRKAALFIWAVYSGTMLLLYWMPFYIDNFTAYSIGIIAAFIVMCISDRRNYCQKIYIAVTFFSLRYFSSFITEIINSFIYYLVADNIYMNQKMSFIVYVIKLFSDILLELAIQYISVWYILRSYVYKYQDITFKEMFMLVLPSITGLSGYKIIRDYQVLYETNGYKPSVGIYNSLALLHYSISIVTIVVITVIFQSIKIKREEETQNKLFAAQAESIKRHICQIEELYQDIRSIKHDMANHIMTLENLYAGNRHKEARAYVEDLKEAFSEVQLEIKSGNPVTDVILKERKNEALKKGIDFECSFHYPEGSGINAFDTSIILNNALQNAIENAGEYQPSYISVVSYRRKNAYMIEVSNSFKGEIRFNPETGLPFTSKEETRNHGYGLANIQKIAGKYFGDIDIVQTDSEFRLVIMLIISTD